MNQIHQEVLETLREEFGDSKVDAVNNLSPDITYRMIQGEILPEIPVWMYDVANKFQELLLNHPRIEITVH